MPALGDITRDDNPGDFVLEPEEFLEDVQLEEDGESDPHTPKSGDEQP
jgi:hypothetical protein